jgi:hypothetical protein
MTQAVSRQPLTEETILNPFPNPYMGKASAKLIKLSVLI